MLSQQSSVRKESIKQEFEEIYKKSTENLFMAPPNKNSLLTKDKYNIWKSQSGLISLSNAGAAKPPRAYK